MESVEVVKKKRRLTGKQKLFAKLYAKTLNGTQSALQAYETNSVDSAKVIASTNLTKVNVKEEISKLMESMGLGIDHILGNIQKIADSPIESRITADQVLKANIEYLKLHDAYPAKKSVTAKYSYSEDYTTMTYQDLKKEIVELRKINDEINGLAIKD